MATPTDPTPRTASTFDEAQALASRRLGFSVTRACPLRCAHCSVSAEPELGHTTYTREFAARVASQIPALGAAGVQWIDFTGGEPMLAGPFVQQVSDAAAAAGLSCGIVTAGHWARSMAAARRSVAAVPGIANWDISTDVYHLEFVPLEAVRHAFEALTEAGRNVMIRIAYREHLPYEDATLIEAVHQFAGRRIGFQPVGPVGRGAELFSYLPVPASERDHGPCPTTGPLIRADGVAAPCCAPLSHERPDHPLMLGNGFTMPLTEIVHRWRVHPLLQTIRLWGFEPVFDWLEAADVDGASLFRHRTCHQCTELVRHDRAADIAMRAASTLAHRVRVAHALRACFGETWLDEELQSEARGAMTDASA